MLHAIFQRRARSRKGKEWETSKGETMPLSRVGNGPGGKQKKMKWMAQRERSKLKLVQLDRGWLSRLFTRADVEHPFWTLVLWPGAVRSVRQTLYCSVLLAVSPFYNYTFWSSVNAIGNRR